MERAAMERAAMEREAMEQAAMEREAMEQAAMERARRWRRRRCWRGRASHLEARLGRRRGDDRSGGSKHDGVRILHSDAMGVCMCDADFFFPDRNGSFGR